MQYRLLSISLLILAIGFDACKKNNNSVSDCFANTATTRQITNQKAIIKLTGTVNSVYLVEEGSIDGKLIPCNFPMEFYQNDLLVTISGEVKQTVQGFGPCCSANFVITKITK